MFSLPASNRSEIDAPIGTPAEVGQAHSAAPLQPPGEAAAGPVVGLCDLPDNLLERIFGTLPSVSDQAALILAAPRCKRLTSLPDSLFAAARRAHHEDMLHACLNLDGGGLPLAEVREVFLRHRAGSFPYVRRLRLWLRGREMGTPQHASNLVRQLVGELPGLSHLALTSVPLPAAWPSEVGSFHHVSCLVLTGSPKKRFKHEAQLPAGLTALAAVRDLTLGCMRCDPDDLQALLTALHLERLRLHDVVPGQALCAVAARCSSLRALRLEQLPGLSHLPPQGAWTQLTSLAVTDCRWLSRLRLEGPYLTVLEELILFRCSALVDLVADLSAARSLTSLDLRWTRLDIDDIEDGLSLLPLAHLNGASRDDAKEAVDEPPPFCDPLFPLKDGSAPPPD